MSAGGWWASHLRPRDVFIWGTVALLLGLAALVLATRRETDEAATLVSLILGAVSTLGGYYQGQKDADAAHGRVRATQGALTELQGELRRLREELGDAKGELDSALPLLEENGKG